MLHWNNMSSTSKTGWLVFYSHNFEREDFFLCFNMYFISNYVHLNKMSILDQHQLFLSGPPPLNIVYTANINIINQLLENMH